ncbi:MAG: hypothetical protein KKB30_03235 [Proteobacteria bacterium]|nr:hypothetical protein [Pseudomonadota bacterium]MBU1714724.1 hypothetical protein [Pseudomonadota bacterium]
MIGTSSFRSYVIFVSFAFFLLFGHSSAQLAQAGKSAYPELAAQLAKETIAILVKQGVCATLPECTSQEWVKMSGTPDLAIIYVFQAESLKSETIGEIINLLLDSYNKNQQRIEIQLNVYKSKHEYNKIFNRAKPFIYLELKGEK